MLSLVTIWIGVGLATQEECKNEDSGVTTPGGVQGVQSLMLGDMFLW